MIDFENPYYLYLLAILPVFVFLYLKNSHKQASIFSKLGDKQLINKLVDFPQPLIRFLKALLLTLAAISMVISLANPFVPDKKQSAADTAKTQIVFALDISKSMLARDVLPSRLGRAQSFILSALDNLNKNEQVAIVIFAGQADTYVPLTTDHNFIKNAVKSISNNLVLKQGTSIKSALKISSSVLNDKTNDVRMICLMSDGETPETNIETYADTIRKSGINILAFGLGTQEGSDIIENIGGNETIKNDRNGRPIISRLHEENLLKIVKDQSNNYFELGDKALAVTFFTNHVKNLQQNIITWIDVKKDYFQLFLLIALFLLAVEALIP